jgi:hypothetical protein
LTLSVILIERCTASLAAIQGSVRGASHINFKTGFNANQTDLEYWIGK